MQVSLSVQKLKHEIDLCMASRSWSSLCENQFHRRWNNVVMVVMLTETGDDNPAGKLSISQHNACMHVYTYWPSQAAAVPLS